MIVLDIETTGLNPGKSGLCEIGAIDLYNPENFFFQDCRIDEEDLIEEKALEVNGKTRIQVLDKTKQTQKELLINFFKWCESVKIKNFICQNPQFDAGFIEFKARKYGLFFPFPHNYFDLHSISQAKYFEVYNEFLIKEGRRSDMNLTNALKFAGLEDKRGFHNALEDVKLTAECFFRIIYGKNLLKEYSIYKIPDYLKKEQNKNDKL